MPEIGEANQGRVVNLKRDASKATIILIAIAVDPAKAWRH